MSLMLLVKPSSWPWGSCVATSPCDDQRKFLAGAAHDSATATQNNTTRMLIASPFPGRTPADLTYCMSDMRAQARTRSAWRWIPTLYFAQAVPFVVVMTVSVVMYKTLGISNTDIALYTSWLYLPWVIKPFWSPLIDMFATKRAWILAMQLAIGASLALVALTLPMAHFFQMSLAVLWLLAFSSA